MRIRDHLTRFLVCATVLTAVSAGYGQQPGTNQVPRPGFVQLNFQGEVRLQALIDYVSQRLRIRFMYSSEVGNRRVNLQAPKEIPVNSLLPLLSSVLRGDNLIIVDAPVEGWKRIVDAKEMPNVARHGQAQEILKQDGPAAPVTHAFVLKHVNAQQVAQVIRPFLTTTGSNILAVQESNVLVVTDYASKVVVVGGLIEMIDRPRGETIYDFYRVQHVTAASLSAKVRAMLGRTVTVGRAPAGQGTVELFDEPRTNQIVVVGTQVRVIEALRLLKRFDVSLGLATKVYRFRHVRAKRFNKIVLGFLAAQDKDRLYTASPDDEGNLLIVQATNEIHERIAELAKQIDAPVKSTESPIRFYKLKNANAIDVLYTLLALQEAGGTTSAFGSAMQSSNDGAPIITNRQRGPAFSPNSSPAGGNSLPSMGQPLQGSQPQGNFQPQGRGGLQAGNLAGGMLSSGGQRGGLQQQRLPLTPGQGETQPYGDFSRAPLNRREDAFNLQNSAPTSALLPGGARVSADISSNSLIVVAPPEIQEMYRGLIESLDKRRPQVLIEARIVAVDTTDNFALGVEVSGGDRTGGRRAFSFTSYGLSEVDPITGALRIIPALGFNGTVVDPTVADLVVQALSTHTRARVLAAPKILVNDNATGQLESVMSVPFGSVNASTTIATTSLGGNQQAGTTITATPHINEDHHLLLEFSVEFSSFTGSATSFGGPDGALGPPPRQIDRIGSVVTIPDGQTVIVGGLKRVGQTRSTAGIPYLEMVPLLKRLTGTESKSISTTSFFLFLRPIILRDDRFADLKFISRKPFRDARVKGQHPLSRPIIIE